MFIYANIVEGFNNEDNFNTNKYRTDLMVDKFYPIKTFDNQNIVINIIGSNFIDFNNLACRLYDGSTLISTITPIFYSENYITCELEPSVPSTDNGRNEKSKRKSTWFWVF